MDRADRINQMRELAHQSELESSQTKELKTIDDLLAALPDVVKQEILADVAASLQSENATK